jgi:hypothetical protein
MKQDNNLGKLSKNEERCLWALLQYMRAKGQYMRATGKDGILLPAIDQLSKMYPPPVNADRRAKSS